MANPIVLKRDDLNDPEVLARRLPAWNALSRLWLDTEQDDGDIHHIVQTLKRAGHDWPTVEHIFFCEVAPVLYSNFFVMPGGEWAAFDQEWLKVRILRYRRRPPARFVERWKKKFYLSLVRKDWSRIQTAWDAAV